MWDVTTLRQSRQTDRSTPSDRVTTSATMTKRNDPAKLSIANGDLAKPHFPTGVELTGWPPSTPPVATTFDYERGRPDRRVTVARRQLAELNARRGAGGDRQSNLSTNASNTDPDRHRENPPPSASGLQRMTLVAQYRATDLDGRLLQMRSAPTTDYATAYDLNDKSSSLKPAHIEKFAPQPGLQAPSDRLVIRAVGGKTPTRLRRPGQTSHRGQAH